MDKQIEQITFDISCRSGNKYSAKFIPLDKEIATTETGKPFYVAQIFMNDKKIAIHQVGGQRISQSIALRLISKSIK
jgi:hypothetical protein